jgi:hypothetical protein
MTMDATNLRPHNGDGLAWQRARKRPVVIDAVQINVPFHVDTKEGRMTGKSGDYLLIGVQGEPYPCDRDIFEATYDV